MHGQHRPVTLIFAKERTLAGLREALDHRRTAVVAEETVYGDELSLRPLFAAMVTVSDKKVTDRKLHSLYEIIRRFRYVSKRVRVRKNIIIVDFCITALRE